MNKNIITVVACTPAGGIGMAGGIPWHIPEDMKRFKAITEGGICIMGRTTYESLNMPEGLPNRYNMVISRTLDAETFRSSNKDAYPSIHQALQQAKRMDRFGDIFIIGGREIYEIGLDYSDTVFLTSVYIEGIDCDTFFPIEKLECFEKVSETPEQIREWGSFQFKRFMRK